MKPGAAMPSFANSYDELPYNDCAYSFTHPDRLAAIARLHGLTPPSVETCRVLELGCGPGGNLIPMAEWLPEGRFVGVDLSSRHIATARATAAAAGLKNVEFMEQDLCDLALSERFDYLICHGVYSWVPPAVQAAIFRLCRQNLADNGIALISYNVYPGWRLKSALRDVLQFAAGDEPEPLVRVQRGLEFLRFLGHAVADKDSWLARECRRAVEALGEDDPTYVFHEYLETHNSPVTFTEFAARAGAAGLRYVDEGSLNAGLYQLEEEVQQALSHLAGDPVRYQQCIDYVLARAFRQTLLCHDTLQPEPFANPAHVRSLCVLGTCVPLAAEPAADPAAVEQFRGANGATVSTDNVWLKAACRVLYAALPAALPFPDLVSRVRDRLGCAGAALPVADEVDCLAKPVLSCARAGLMELHVRTPPLACVAAPQPVASPYGRWRAARGKDVVNAWHSRIELDSLHRTVLQRLDGNADRSTLERLLEERVPGEGQDAQPAVTLEEVLQTLVRRAFLVGPAPVAGGRLLVR